MASRAHAPDYLFVGSVFLLTIFGLVMLSSATAAVGFEKFGDTYYFLKRQLLFGFLPGIFVFFILLRVPYGAFRKARTIIFLASLVLLALVLVPGIGASFGRTQSWLSIGGFSLQPAEFAKIGLILFLAGWLDERRDGAIETIRYGILPFLVLMGIMAVLLALQPDVGTLAVVLAVGFSLLIVAGARWKHIVVLLLIGLLAFGALVVAAPYRVERLTTFLHPELDPQGAGYQINQAFLAIGTGGWLGAGLGHSRQKFQYLPEVASDSIFAIIAEELGFLVAGALVLLFVVMWLRMLRIARAAPDAFGRFVVFGVAVWLLTQTWLNVGAMVGLLPLTGLPLPFVSHGGTALLAALAGAGIVARISQYSKPI